MTFSFKPLWKKLHEKKMTKRQLMLETGISKSTVDKMGRCENISMAILDRLCDYFECPIEEIIKHEKM